MNDKVQTSSHNINVLYELGFQKFKNTTLFQKGIECILSPSVSKNSVGGYWFDIRQVNLERVNNEAMLLVRIVPDLFIIEFLKDLSSLISEKLMDNRPHSGNVWGIGLEINTTSKKVLIFNKKNPSNKFLTKLLNKEQVIEHYKKLASSK